MIYNYTVNHQSARLRKASCCNSGILYVGTQNVSHKYVLKYTILGV